MYLAPLPGPAVETRLRAPSAIRYVKLGKSGSWAPAAIEQSIIPCGFSQIPHARCASAAWPEIGQQLIASGRSPGGASSGVRELRDFYELGDHALWVTFADRHVYWCFAEREVFTVDEPESGGWHRFRRCIGRWSRTSLTGEPLSISSLSSALTRVAGFRQTICSVERQDYLLRRIRGDEEPLLLKVQEIRAELEAVALEMIAGLD